MRLPLNPLQWIPHSIQILNFLLFSDIFFFVDSLKLRMEQQYTVQSGWGELTRVFNLAWPGVGLLFHTGICTHGFKSHTTKIHVHTHGFKSHTTHVYYVVLKKTHVPVWLACGALRDRWRRIEERLSPVWSACWDSAWQM